MKGSYDVDVQNKRIRYQFRIKRNITIIRGDSATGKTNLLDMIESYARNGRSSGIQLSCNVPCIVLYGDDWKQHLSSIHNCIVFIDECNAFIRTEEFARAVNHSDNYFVLVTRDDLPNLSYSVEEIYGIRQSKTYAGLKQTYNEFYHLYGEYDNNSEEDAEIILVEDSNSGFEFYKAIVKDGVVCNTAQGKTKIYRILLRSSMEEKITVIADGAAFGPEMERIMQLIGFGKHITLYLPESFEWVLLSADLLNDKEVREILEKPEDYIESEKFSSWEQYFTKLLITKTTGTFMRYQKDSINVYYLQKKVIQKILEVFPDKIKKLMFQDS